jgi:hypothetical protein
MTMSASVPAAGEGTGLGLSTRHAPWHVSGLPSYRPNGNAIASTTSQPIRTEHSSFERMGISMPLTRGQIAEYDNGRLAFAFTMLNDGETVQCQISDAAMDELANAKGTPSIARQAQFVSHRDTIEQIASDLYDGAPRFKGYVVRIFTKHVRSARGVA